MVLLLSGANGFAVQQAMNTLVAAFLRKHGMHAIERVDGETFDATRLPELLQSISLFAPQRLIILRDSSKNKALWDRLGDELEKVPDGVTLVVIEPAPDKRTRTYKQLQKHGDVREFPELNEHEAAKWIQAAAKNEGGDIDFKTAQHLVAQVGIDQWRLFTELQKLLGYDAHISVGAIDELVEPNPQASAFDLLDAVLAGDSAKATVLLARLKSSEDPYKLFGLLVSQIQTLALVVTAQRKPPELIAKEGGIHPFVVRKMQAVARNVSYEQLQDIIASVARTDVQLKSTGVDPWVLLEQCLGKIASRQST